MCFMFPHTMVKLTTDSLNNGGINMKLKLKDGTIIDVKFWSMLKAVAICFTVVNMMSLFILLAYGFILFVREFPK